MIPAFHFARKGGVGYPGLQIRIWKFGLFPERRFREVRPGGGRVEAFY